jgi:hypothetical protein
MARKDGILVRLGSGHPELGSASNSAYRSRGSVITNWYGDGESMTRWFYLHEKGFTINVKINSNQNVMFKSRAVPKMELLLQTAPAPFTLVWPRRSACHVDYVFNDAQCFKMKQNCRHQPSYISLELRTPFESLSSHFSQHNDQIFLHVTRSLFFYRPQL